MKKVSLKSTIYLILGELQYDKALAGANAVAECLMIRCTALATAAMKKRR
ncbi:hypothetical protein KFZ76_07505 [Methylovulum psychrotolerans]|nr:hypothetical protein [Methylovulum psychrotolerans]MBT9097551.1 hypothetical protein [Methylovulum psychrotolerans]